MNKEMCNGNPYVKMNKPNIESGNIIVTEENVDAVLEKEIFNNYKATFGEIVSISIVAISIIIFLANIGYGAITRHLVEKRCNVETVAELVDVREEEYQYVPYLGDDRVRTGNEYFLTYQFNINDFVCSINKHSYDTDYPDHIDIKYNPNDLTEYLYNNDEFVIGDGEAWVWIKDNK